MGQRGPFSLSWDGLVLRAWQVNESELMQSHFRRHVATKWTVSGAARRPNAQQRDREGTSMPTSGDAGVRRGLGGEVSTEAAVGHPLPLGQLHVTVSCHVTATLTQLQAVLGPGAGRALGQGRCIVAEAVECPLFSTWRLVVRVARGLGHTWTEPSGQWDPTRNAEQRDGGGTSRLDRGYERKTSISEAVRRRFLHGQEHSHLSCVLRAGPSPGTLGAFSK